MFCFSKYVVGNKGRVNVRIYYCPGKPLSLSNELENGLHDTWHKFAGAPLFETDQSNQAINITLEVIGLLILTLDLTGYLNTGALVIDV